MIGDALTWFSDPSPATEADVISIETAIGIRFPPDYLDFVKTFGGGAPNESDFEFPDKSVGVFHAAVGEFLTALPEHPLNILSCTRRTEGLPMRLVPFAIDGGGNLICFDYRSVGLQISFLHHGRCGFPDEISFVAPSFARFVDMLHPPSETS